MIRRTLKAIPVMLAVSLLLVSCASTRKAEKVETPDIKPMVEKLFDARPTDELDLIDPMVSYWNIAYNSKVIADSAYEWKDYSGKEAELIEFVTEMWPFDISEASALVLALVPTDPELVEDLAPIAYLYYNYGNHVEMYVNWKNYAEAMEDYLVELSGC